MALKQGTVLVVDDERSITDLLSEELAEGGYNCVTAATGEDALKRLSMDNIDAVLLDLRLPGISGMEVLREAKAIHPGIAVIVVTAVGDAQTAVEAMKIGAVDYITKPFELERVNDSLKAALKAKTVWRDISVLQGEGAGARGEELDWTDYLDDIAEGVEIRLDSLTGYAMTITVIERTLGIARDMEIPEAAIAKWADARQKRVERIKLLDTLLEQAGQSPVA